jgi:hypothetical protein
VTFLAHESGLVGVVSVGVDRVDFICAASFVAVFSDTTDAIFVVAVDFVVSCFAAFDTVNEGNNFIFTFVALVIAVV